MLKIKRNTRGVFAGILIESKGFDKYNGRGCYVVPKRVREKDLEPHAVLLAGYNERRRYFNFMNNHGREFGDNGFGKIRFEDVEQFVVPVFIDDVKDYLNMELPTDSSPDLPSPPRGRGSPPAPPRGRVLNRRNRVDMQQP
ncbi:hypothetical protein PIB30_107173, partial [Stylosanthes scabra]|nr:hypothetical protein [Stylosanthes scabra]